MANNLSINDPNNLLSISPTALGPTGAVGNYGCDTYTISGGGVGGTVFTTVNATESDVMTTIGKNGIKLSGEADLTIGDQSLKDFMTEVRSRLAMLAPNPAIEAEWNELKKLGDDYRRVEAEIKAKMEVWEILNRP